MSLTALPKEFWDQEVMTTHNQPTDWLWHGFIARGNTTLLTGTPKAGKTTLLSLLLARRKEGGSVGGMPIKPGKTIIITEEYLQRWAERGRELDFGGQVCFLERPFLTIPTVEQWQALLNRVLELRAQHGIDLAVVDPLAPFFRCENNARNILETMLPLRALAKEGMAVVGMHHPAKRERPLGQAARGSNALLGHVDISIEMRQPAGDPLTRRRRFFALSRLPQTPRSLLMELNAEGSDYIPLEDDGADPFPENWKVVRMVLEDATHKRTRQEILQEWPADFDKPHPDTLGKWLVRAVAESLVAREGSGRKSEPFLYWLPEREAVWKNDPLYNLEELYRKDKKKMDELLAGQPPWPTAPSFQNPKPGEER
jgi:hypothetical protein